MRRTALVVKQLTPHAGSLLSGRAVTMEIVKNLRAMWPEPDRFGAAYEYQIVHSEARLRKQAAKARSGISSSIAAEEDGNDEEGDEEETQPVDSGPAVRLPLLLRGKPAGDSLPV